MAECDLLEGIINGLLEQINALDAGPALDDARIDILDHAVRVVEPVWPRLVPILGMGSAVGLLLGSSLVVIGRATSWAL